MLICVRGIPGSGKTHLASVGLFCGMFESPRGRDGIRLSR